LIARLDNEELDIDAYRQEIDRLARFVAERFPKNAKPDTKLDALNQFLFKERGFHGSHSDYYSKSNSYLNEVIDDREGLPITLSVLYMEIARKLKLNVVGLALPGHSWFGTIPPRATADRRCLRGQGDLARGGGFESEEGHGPDRVGRWLQAGREKGDRDSHAAQFDQRRRKREGSRQHVALSRRHRRHRRGRSRGTLGRGAVFRFQSNLRAGCWRIASI